MKSQWILYGKFPNGMDFHKTRMHSSRMRTAHFSGRIWGEGFCLGGICWGVSAQGGVCLEGVYPGGVRGPWTQRQTPPLHAGIHTPPAHCMLGYIHPLPIACWDTHTQLLTEWLIDRCKNITFPQLRLRAVKIKIWRLYYQLHYESVCLFLYW